uniref:S0_2.126 n=1 Tax=synthetic construct TaxID=32630 RepID=UPI00143F05A9|nr:Chain M, S0_2.126 [synthetic construct]6S3D_N Chain N, S0_2.126 [synthetic construct]6S3D_O Chain O, S0_2.126 [synthetic construct]6S3D_P Chain P, S0_2.126 [synthetic construct]6XWI_A Chain A, S0_2.126 [synthetic construct]
ASPCDKQKNYIDKQLLPIVNKAGCSRPEEVEERIRRALKKMGDTSCFDEILKGLKEIKCGGSWLEHHHHHH